jgi:galactokinase/mevalonate kinase-like predicted kinase
MVTEDTFSIINNYKNTALGWKLSGAGGGGYLIFVSDKPMRGAMKIKIRRKSP